MLQHLIKKFRRWCPFPLSYSAGSQYEEILGGKKHIISNETQTFNIGGKGLITPSGYWDVHIVLLHDVSLLANMLLHPPLKMNKTYYWNICTTIVSQLMITQKNNHGKREKKC